MTLLVKSVQFGLVILQQRIGVFMIQQRLTVVMKKKWKPFGKHFISLRAG
jgi:hypothetical protein